MLTKQMLGTAVKNALDIQKAGLPRFTTSFKSICSEGNFYSEAINTEWGTGFCTGQYWLAYELTGDEAYKKAALVQVDDFLNRIEIRHDVDHHDMGFLYSLSCVAAYKLTGSETGKKAALMAADNLIARYHEVGEFIQAWGELGTPENYRLIVDCLLNLPLLYWATEITADKKYAEIANKHAETALGVLLREDYSSHHTFFFDTKTGAPLKGVTHQGYSGESFWARGQSWAVYGIALCYRYTKKPEYMALFEKVTEFFMEHLPEDKVPYWDMIFTKGDEPRDSSASAIAVCGILEMVQYFEGEKAKVYEKMADELLCALIEHCAVPNIETSNGVLMHGVYGKSSPYNEVEDNGVDECNCWGDYFYMEALARKTIDWNLYW